MSLIADRNLGAGREEKVGFYRDDKVTYGELAYRINHFGPGEVGRSVSRVHVLGRASLVGGG